MREEPVEVKQSNIVWARICMFFKNIFGHKTQMLSEAPAELSAEYQELLEKTKKLSEDNSFDALKNILDSYSLGTDKDGKTIAIDKNAGYEIDNKNIIVKLKFATIWNKVATITRSDIDENEVNSFGEGARKTYEKISEIAHEQLKKTGNIDTANILNTVKNLDYRWARQISRKLFKSDIQANTITEYFRAIVKKPKKQTKKTLTTTKALYGMDEE